MDMYNTPSRRSSCVKPHKPDDVLDSAPAELDPAAHPIIARHIFGIVPFRPIGPGEHSRAQMMCRRRLHLRLLRAYRP